MRAHAVTNYSVCIFSQSQCQLQPNLIPPALQQGPVPARTCSPWAEDDAEGACAVCAGAAVGAEQKGGSSLADAAPRFAFQVSLEHPALQGTQLLPRAAAGQPTSCLVCHRAPGQLSPQDLRATQLWG